MRLILAEGLGFEPSHNDFRDRRATVTLALSIFVPVCPGCQASFRFVNKVKKITLGRSYGRDSGIRTHTGRILSPLSLPVGLYPHNEAKDSDFHRGVRLNQKSLIAYWGQGATPG